MELLQPFRSLIENFKIPSEKLRDQNNNRHIKLFDWMLITLCFYRSFLKKVRSHLGEPAYLTGPAHLLMNNPLIQINCIAIIDITGVE